MATITKSKRCARCGNDIKAELVRNVVSNGASQVYWRCPACRKAITNPPVWISHEQVKAANINIDDLPIIENYSRMECSVRDCQNIGIEYNHWAPRHLFRNDADKWPGDYLCPIHHREWHDKVTPNMSGNGRH